MKNLSIFIAAIAMIFIASCTQSHDKTVANLKASIIGEASSSAKYAAFAEQAAKEGYHGIAAMFRATHEAEKIHLKNHNDALILLGVADYVPVVPVFQVQSTLENIRGAIEGEKYEDETMYEEFVATAKAEKVDKAAESFAQAQAAERCHAKLFTEAERIITESDVEPTVYCVCPTCGNIYVASAPEACDVCRVPAAAFVVVTAK